MSATYNFLMIVVEVKALKFHELLTWCQTLRQVPFFDNIFEKLYITAVLAYFPKKEIEAHREYASWQDEVCNKWLGLYLNFHLDLMGIMEVMDYLYK